LTRNTAILFLILIYWALHQDTWFWNSAEPLAFGFLPAGLTYHAVYTLGAAVLMAVLVKAAWPAALEYEVDRDGEDSSRS
jgi:hypothetical protein